MNSSEFKKKAPPFSTLKSLGLLFFKGENSTELSFKNQNES